MANLSEWSYYRNSHNTSYQLHSFNRWYVHISSGYSRKDGSNVNTNSGTISSYNRNPVTEAEVIGTPTLAGIRAAAVINQPATQPRLVLASLSSALSCKLLSNNNVLYKFKAIRATTKDGSKFAQERFEKYSPKLSKRRKISPSCKNFAKSANPFLKQHSYQPQLQPHPLVTMFDNSNLSNKLTFILNH